MSMAYDNAQEEIGRSGSSAASRFGSPTAIIRVDYALPTLVGQHFFAIALAYEDLVNHDDLRRDPHDPMVSPLRSLSFADLPPTLASVGRV